jgi:hypothetical protein
VLGQSCINGQPKYDYEGYDACIDCTGTTTTTEAPATTTQAPDNVFVMERQSDGFAVYVQIDSDFQVGDISLSISTFPNQCFDISGTAFVQTPTDYGIITGTCTTTTTTTTTTTVVCGTQQLYYGISAQTACCDTFTTKAVYMNANDISSATIIYQDDTCSAVLSTNRYFTADFTEYYYWNGSTLTGPTTCPDCQQQ